MNKQHIIELNDVTKIFKGLDTPVLDKINLQLNQSENIAISGVSGSGKSTLLHLIAGLDMPSEGSVIINNLDIKRLNQNELASMRNKSIGFVYQGHHLLPDFSALENTLMPLIINGGNFIKNQNKAIQILKK